MQFQHNICIPIYVIYVVPIVAAILTISVGLIVRKIYISRASSLSSSSSSHSNNSNKQVRRDSTEPLMPKDGEKPNMYDVVASTNNFLATVGPVSAPSTPEAGGSENFVVEVENLTHEIHSKEKEIERLSAEKEEFSVFLIRDLLASQKLTEELKKEVEYLKRQLSDSDTRQIETPLRPRRAMESEEVLKLQQTVQELNAKIKALELQLKSRPLSPSLSNNNTPHPIDRDRSFSLSISSSRLLSKPHDANRLSIHAIPLSSPNSPIPSSSSSAIGIPMLNIYAEETAIETKKRELEITKEFSNREASTPRDAVSPRDTSALKWRMEKGNKLDAFDKDGYLLIHRAVLEDRWDVVKHLMQIGADMNAYDARGETALHLAVRNDNELMVDYLLLYEADPNAAGGRDKNTPMHLCSYHGYIKSAGALTKAGANIEAKNEDGYTPLRIAIDREQVDFAIWIIEKHNANVNCVDDLGETLLTYGVRINKASLIDFLLDNGANPDLADDRNLTPCMVAARAENSDIIRMLISRGAGVDAINTDGQTSLHFAASSGSAGAAQTLLELGANVDATDARGNTPLHESCKNSKFSVSARLVANKAELNLQGGDGLTPLALAICCNDDDTVALLMSNGAN